MRKLTFLLLLTTGCTLNDKNQRPNMMATKVGHQFQSSDGWLKGNPQWHANSPGKPYSISLDNGMNYQNQPTLRFEMRKGDAWIGPKGSKTYRNELIPSDFPPPKSIRYYGCNIFIPKDFPIEDNRLVLMQWWSQAKTEMGEKGKSPSLALRYTKGTISATIRHSDVRVVTEPDNVPQKRIFESQLLKKGQWNHFIFQVRWSFKDDGFVKIWWNKKLVTDYRGPIGYDDDQGPLFKFGMYRDDSPKTYIAYFNNCREAKDLSAIIFTQK
jgi:hypothetical protein